MSDNNNTDGGMSPPPPPPASTRPRAVSNPQPVPGTALGTAGNPTEAGDVMPDMPTLASSFSANNALAVPPGLPASLPRSHIAQVLENYLVSTSPRSGNAAAGIPLGSTPPGSALNPNSDSGSNTPLLERRRTSSIARNTPTPSVRALPLNGSSSNGASPIPPRTRRISTALGILPPPAVATAPASKSNAQTTAPATSAADDDELVAAQLLDPAIGSPALALLSGFAVRDVYKYREQPIINRVVHGRRRAKSMSSVPKGIARALHVRFSDDGKSKHSASASSASPTLVPVSVDEDIEVPNPARPLHLLRARDLLVPGGLRRFFLLHMDPRRHERVAAAISRRASSAQHGRSTSLPSDGRPVLTQLAPTHAKPLSYGTLTSSSDATPHRRSSTHLSDPHAPLLRSPPPTPYGLLPTRSFFDFLAMGYQQYGGAALWDEDELEDWGIPAPRVAPPAGSAAWGSGLLGFGALVDEEEVGLFLDQDEQEAGLGEGAYDESSALLGAGGRRVLSRASSRAASLRSPLVAPSGPAAQPVGTASSRKAFLLLIKASIGTGVLFLPSAFKDGGLTFSFLFLILIAWLSARGMLLLAKVNLRVPGSFGDIAETLYGPVLRYLVLASITMSQMGFCAAYIVFIGQNLLGLLKQMNLSPSWALGPHGMAYLIAIQVCIYIPMALVRKIKAFAGFSLIGDVFILGGLAVVCVAAFSTMAEQGGPSPDVVHFNKQSFPLFIGTAVYTFEGVGLVIPIAQSMRNPHNFGKVLTAVMVVATAVYLFVASCGYLAWGNQVQTIVLLNLPQSGVAQAVFILYIIAIVFTWPLVLFPVARILEQGLLPHASGKHSAWHKWQKNALRTGLVLAVATLALAGADALNKLVALIGSFACIPLSFLYPTAFHLRVFPDAGWGTKVLDWGMFVFGILLLFKLSNQTIS
ncbi:transmembrane amino acid transporter protein-domain-containing protein [Catenaria anguillulae PL171]|uniref:Transmembrane amino acid transporter protein-domain-containing protein n=1 Tax=Catenaria anguillulae PL171 TaxID=765915 RepID=A0A1Y2HKP7_9FUNG|nr:transmembrane amino acid transporter protein-domain-containing protein [Catenaria anguillulae PL171]